MEYRVVGTQEKKERARSKNHPDVPTELHLEGRGEKVNRE